jgi:hypothetical protein
MKIVIWSACVKPATLVGDGFARLGHSVNWRNPRYFTVADVEEADLAIVIEGQRLAEIADMHRQRGIRVLCVGPGYVGVGQWSCRLDSWRDVPEFACPTDRAKDAGLLASECKIENGVVKLGDCAIAEIGDPKTDLQSFLNRVAYGQWSESEIASGKAVAFCISALKGSPFPPATQEQKPQPQQTKPQASTKPPEKGSQPKRG